MKKLISLFLSAALLCGCMAAVSCKQKENGGETAVVWSALSTEKYMQDKAPASYTEAKLDFAGVKGETQSMQLMITAKEDIKGFDLTAGALAGAGGAKIEVSSIKIYAERYVEIYNPFATWAGGGSDFYSEAGYYPDALVPIEKYQLTREDRVKAGHNQGIWIDIEIPADAAHGEYTGEFTLELNNDTDAPETMKIPVKLKVYDILMPEEVHAASCFNIWWDQLGFGEGDNYDENTNQVYYDFLLSKRLCSGDVHPDYTKSNEAFAEHIVTLAQNPKVTCYRIIESLAPGLDLNKAVPSAGSAYTEAEIEQAKAQVQTALEEQLTVILEKNLQLRDSGDPAYADLDLFKKAIYYYEDEPTVGIRTERIRMFCEKLNAAKNALVERYAEDFAKYPDLKESLLGVDNVTPSNALNAALFVSSKNDPDEPYEPDYDKCDGLTHWCPEMYKWSETAFRNTVEERMSYGEEFWWYTCVINSPAPTYYVESMPINIRLASWMQYQYGVTGTLYWDVVHWKEIEGGDPYEDVQYREYGGGEGLLIYPGAKYGQKTPVSSIRLEQIRAGQQDYEYFYMLDGYLQQYGMDCTAADILAAMSKNLYRATTTLDTASYTEFEENRIEILEILQDFVNGDKDAAQSRIDAVLN